VQTNWICQKSIERAFIWSKLDLHSCQNNEVMSCQNELDNTEICTAAYLLLLSNCDVIWQIVV